MSRKNYKQKGKGKQNKQTEPRTSSSEEEKKGTTPAGDDAKSKDAENASKKNDPEWYAEDPQLLLDAASIPFSYPVGQPLILGDNNSTWGSIPLLDYHHQNGVVPGLLTYKIKPTYGFSMSKKDPLNIAAIAFYSHVRYVNSGRRNYDPSDLMMYTLAIADIYSYILWLQKIYQCAFMYSQRNWYIGRIMVEEMGVDFDDVVRNLANFRYMVNTLINKVTAWAVPSSIKLFMRKAFMYANTYTQDEDGSIRDQLYQFAPDGFYHFRLDERSKGMLAYKPLHQDDDKKFTIAYLQQYANTMIDALTGDEDFGLMSGDIIKAYGDNLIMLKSLDADPVLNIVYDANVLNQMHNAVWCQDTFHAEPDMEVSATNEHSYAIPDSGTVTQYAMMGSVYQNDVGNLISVDGATAPSTTSTDYTKNNEGYYCLDFLSEHDQLLDIPKQSPDPLDVVEATRLKFVTNFWHKKNNRRQYYYDCGSEVVLSVSVAYFMGEPSSHAVSPQSQKLNNVVWTYSTEYSMGQSVMFLYFTFFRHSPVEYYLVYSNTAKSWVLVQPVAQLTNHTLVNKDTLVRLHEVALLSLVYVPGVAKVTNWQ